MRKTYQGYDSDGFYDSWTTEDGQYTFYTIEYDWSEYIDFYDNEVAWKQAIEDGLSNNERVESLPNFFKDENAADTFETICAEVEQTHNIKTAIDNVLDKYDLGMYGELIPKENN